MFFALIATSVLTENIFHCEINLRQYSFIILFTNVPTKTNEFEVQCSFFPTTTMIEIVSNFLTFIIAFVRIF